MSTLSDNLKSLRKERKMTQQALAEAVNVSQNAIYNWENGKREPNIEMIRALAKALKADMDSLLATSEMIEGVETKVYDLTHINQDQIPQVLKHIKEGRNTTPNQHEIVFTPIDALIDYFQSEGFSEEELEDIKQYAEFVKSKRDDDWKKLKGALESIDTEPKE